MAFGRWVDRDGEYPSWFRNSVARRLWESLRKPV